MTKKRQPQSIQAHKNQLRIIGGQWRGQKLTLIDSEGLRPTSGRVRETLFNWLTNSVASAHCLDLFAGSGALGIEALSRGASHVDFIESESKVCRQLQQQLVLLKATNATVWQNQAQNWLNQLDTKQHRPYDIVFIDPPFGMDLVQQSIDFINDQHLLAPQASVYLEMGAQEALPRLPPLWEIHREKMAGQVCYRLLTTQDT